MLKEIIVSFQSFLEAHRFINKHKLWKWIIIPGIIYGALFMVGMYFFIDTSGYATQYFVTKSGLKTWVDSFNTSWLNFIIIIIQAIIMIVLFLFYFSLFRFVFLIIGSPVFAFLSEKTESILESKDFPFSLPQFLKDIIRGVKIATRNLLWQSFYLLAILLLSILPIVGMVAPLVALLTECYYFGFSMLDYSSERHKLTTTQSIAFIGKHKGLAIGNGMVFYLMHLLPIVGWLLAPTYAVVAATLSLHKAKQKQIIF